MKASRTYLKHSSIHGTGLFADCKIRKGEGVIEYTGTIRPWHECEYGADGYTYLMSLDDQNVIDPRDGGNDARFINHSCDPNCQALVDGLRVFIVAEKTIEKDEEITIDYGLILPHTPTQSDYEMYSCHCGVESCRGSMVGESAQMPDEETAA